MKLNYNVKVSFQTAIFFVSILTSSFRIGEQRSVKCRDDDDCQAGKTYCKDGFCDGDCIICGMFNRENTTISSGCAKTKEDCGRCKPGMTEEELNNNQYSIWCNPKSGENNVPNGKHFSCRNDDDCQAGKTYCKDGFCDGDCIICGMFNRENTTIPGGCAKMQEDCGQCIPGTSEEELNHNQYPMWCNPNPRKDNVVISTWSLSTGEIVGICFASLLVIGLITALLFFYLFYFRRKKQVNISETSKETGLVTAFLFYCLFFCRRKKLVDGNSTERKQSIVINSRISETARDSQAKAPLGPSQKPDVDKRSVKVTNQDSPEKKSLLASKSNEQKQSPVRKHLSSKAEEKFLDDSIIVDREKSLSSISSESLTVLGNKDGRIKI